MTSTAPKSKGRPPPLEPPFSSIRTSLDHSEPLRDASERTQCPLWRDNHGRLPGVHPGAPSQDGDKIGGEKLVDGDKNGRPSWPPRPEDEGGQHLCELSLAAREHPTTPNIWPRRGDSRISPIWGEEGSASRAEGDAAARLGEQSQPANYQWLGLTSITVEIMGKTDTRFH